MAEAEILIKEAIGHNSESLLAAYGQQPSETTILRQRRERLKSLSLASRRSRHQLYIAIALIVIIPLLSLCFAVLSPIFGPKDPATLPGRCAIVVFAAVIAVSGVLILQRYPRNIERMRDYLKDIAEGNLPEKIELIDPEDDISAIQTYLNMIVADLRRQIAQLQEQLERSRLMQRTIKAQAEQILQAERQRVMIESLAATCHHIGQPATVLRVCMQYLQKYARTEEERVRIDQCNEAVEAIADILERLRHVSQYRTVPYLVLGENGLPHNDIRILDIGETSKPDNLAPAEPARAAVTAS